MKNFEAAVRQGRGAARALTKGVVIESPLFAEPLRIDPMGRIHVVVVLSEMHGHLDWAEVARILIKESSGSTFFHVLDLSELQRLVSACCSAGEDQAARLLEPNMLRRWLAMEEHGSAFVHGRVRPK